MPMSRYVLEHTGGGLMVATTEETTESCDKRTTIQ
jgi:hypothetical protein